MGLCWLWIPGSGELAKPLTEATRDEEAEAIAWGPEREQGFKAIKGVSLSALGLPGYAKPFNSYVHEQKGIASAVINYLF